MTTTGIRSRGSTASPSGRGVLPEDRSPGAPVTRKQVDAPLAYATPACRALLLIPNGLLNSASVRAFNEAWFHKHPKSRSNEIHSIRVSSTHSMGCVIGIGSTDHRALQYQFVVPDGLVGSSTNVVSTARCWCSHFLTVLKRFGPANPLLVLPTAGWTGGGFRRAMSLGSILDELDELVAEASGRLYFAKDSRQSPSMVARTYPRAEWHSVRDQMDPGSFHVRLGRRLSL